MVTKGKWPFVVWVFLFSSTFCSLLWWRLFIT